MTMETPKCPPFSHETKEAAAPAAQAFEDFLQGGALTFTGVVGIAEGGMKRPGRGPHLGIDVVD